MSGARIRIRPQPTAAEAEAVRQALAALGVVEPAGPDLSREGREVGAREDGGLSPIDGEPAA